MHDTVPRPTTFPVFAGLCSWCLRAMWSGELKGTGLLAWSEEDPLSCYTCHKWRRIHPGEDPRHNPATAAYRIPAERPEIDAQWRAEPDRPCREVPEELFHPMPSDEDPAGRVLLADAEWVEDRRAEQRQAAEVLCGRCPVFEGCRWTARVQGYEGVWGRAVFTRFGWQDPVSGENGRTIHTTEGREAVAAEWAQRLADAQPTNEDAA